MKAVDLPGEDTETVVFRIGLTDSSEVIDWKTP